MEGGRKVEGRGKKEEIKKKSQKNHKTNTTRKQSYVSYLTIAKNINTCNWIWGGN